MITKSILIFIVSAFTASATALTVELNFNDQVFSNAKGMLNYVALKQAVSKQRPDIKLANYKLTRIILVAKSQYGGGKARSRIGSAQGEMVDVPGMPGNWQGGGENTFYTLDLPGPGNNAFGGAPSMNATSDVNWQIAVTGNVRVRRVTLELNAQAQSPQPPFAAPAPAPAPSPTPAPAPSPAPAPEPQGPLYCEIITECYDQPVFHFCPTGPDLPGVVPLVCVTPPPNRFCSTREICY